jgi:hypothetical protein
VLIDAYGLAVPLPRILSAIASAIAFSRKAAGAL